MAHLVRTAEVWDKLRELGASESTPLDFDFQFRAQSEESVAKLKKELEEYVFNVVPADSTNGAYILDSSSGAILWTEELLLKWVSYLILVGDSCGCTFESCGASAPNG